MFSTRTKLVALALFAACATAAPATAQDSGPLLDLLVRKGILTEQEAASVRSEMTQNPGPSGSIRIAFGRNSRGDGFLDVPVTAASDQTSRFTLGGRLQGQYAGLSTDIDGSEDPASTSHFFLRRVYLSAKVDLSESWSLALTYDFASDGFDEAVVRWKKYNHTIDAGLRKVNTAFEERSSSGSIKAIERSAVTRYFVEPNNGRRLGAASYRVGLFYDGESGPFFYGAAVTNPERTEDFSFAAGSGDATNNTLAYWVNAGITGESNIGGYRFGVAAGFLSGQGGAGSDNRGQGFDLTLYSAHATFTRGRFSLLAEVLAADVERGAALVAADARPIGFVIQPSWMVSDQFELLARHAWVDSDGRGISLADGVRSAPSGGVMDKLSELYFGGNYYFLENDLKLQMGYVHGRTKDALSGESAEATTHGLRSQVQLQF
ncbi:MAG: porin [Opitutaceae bacterium]